MLCWFERAHSLFMDDPDVKCTRYTAINRLLNEDHKKGLGYVHVAGRPSGLVV